MPWGALPDEFHDNPAIIEAGLAAAGLYARCTTYCARHLTDGRVPRLMLHRLCDGDVAPLSALLRAGLLHEDGDHFEVVGYLDANPTREVALERKRKRKERAERAAAKRWEAERARREEVEAESEAKTYASPEDDPDHPGYIPY